MLKLKILFILLLLHILSIIGLFVIKKIKPFTILLQIVIFIISSIGVTVGYHRLWCHKTFEASPFLQWLLMIFGSSAGQGDAIWWSKTHRTHHRNEDLMTDPYSISKGFFFAHFGWLCQYPDIETQKEIDITDVSDLENNNILAFQQKYFVYLWVIISIIIPILICKLWNETFINAFFSTIIRIVLAFNSTWCVNSLAHMYGDKPYNNKIEPSENLFVSLITFGEGWHNYHHTYPKDYRASEEHKYNPNASFIDLMANLGFVTNRYTVCEKTKNVKGNDKFDKKYYENKDMKYNYNKYNKHINNDTL
jgi:stearoyl-CoA desaturase (delta-9 desaturase)